MRSRKCNGPVAAMWRADAAQFRYDDLRVDLLTPPLCSKGSSLGPAISLDIQKGRGCCTRPFCISIAAPS